MTWLDGGVGVDTEPIESPPDPRGIRPGPWPSNLETDVAVVAEWLDENPTVMAYRYINQSETDAEFRAYFEDEPEILDLVRPDQLPTSFVVTTTDSAGLAKSAEALAAIQQVQLAEPADN